MKKKPYCAHKEPLSSGFCPDCEQDVSLEVQFKAMTTHNSPEQKLIEEWRPVVGYEGLYEVSSHGRVRSYNFNGRRRVQPKILKLQFNVRHGYVQVCLRKDRKQYMPRVHRLVLSAFVGPCPTGYEGAHNDGDKQNNQLNNLSWKTHSDNMQDQVLHGSMIMGIKHHNAKLNPSKVKTIRKLYKENGYTKAALARMFNVGGTAIYSILKGTTWRKCV